MSAGADIITSKEGKTTVVRKNGNKLSPLKVVKVTNKGMDI